MRLNDWTWQGTDDFLGQLAARGCKRKRKGCSAPRCMMVSPLRKHHCLDITLNLMGEYARIITAHHK